MDIIVVLFYSFAILGAFLTSGGNVEPLWFGQSALSPLFLGLAVLPIIWGIWLFSKRHFIRIQYWELFIPISLLFSVVWAPYTLNTNFHITQVHIWFVFWMNAIFMTKLIASRENNLNKLLQYINSSAFIFLAITLITALFSNQLKYGVHLSGYFGLHNSFAAAVMLCCSVSLFSILYKFSSLKENTNNQHEFNKSQLHNILLKSISLGTLVLGLIAIFYSQSRGVWLCFGLQILIIIGYFIFTSKSIRLKLIVLFIFVCAVSIIAFVPSRFKEHVLNAFNSNDFSVRGRIRFHQVAAKMITNPPLTGFGNYRFRYPSLQTDPDYYATDPHDIYIQILSEGQWLGLFLLLAISISLIFAIKKRKKITPARIVALSGLIALAVHLGIDFDFTFTSNGLLFGLLWALWQLPDNTETDIVENNRYTVILNASIAVILIFGGLLMSICLTAIQFSRKGEDQQLTNREYWANLSTKLNPIDQKTWRSLAYSSSDRETCLNAFKQVNLLSPMDARAWNETARALEISSDLKNEKINQEINNCYLRSIECDPINRPYLYYDLARFYKKIGQKDNQLKTLQTMLIAFNWEKPITPEHPRPQWVNYNSVMVEVMVEIVKLEAELNIKTHLTDVCLHRIPIFRKYLKDTEVNNQ